MSTRRWKRGLLIGSGILAALCVIAVAGFYALVVIATNPLNDGAVLADRAISIIVTDEMGPVYTGAYRFDLGDGGIGLVDSGLDSDATAITQALNRMSHSVQNVRAILLTHEHDDHVTGALAFPHADVYIHDSFSGRFHAMRSRAANVTGKTFGESPRQFRRPF